MPASNSQFFLNIVKTFTPKVPGGTVFSDDMNEATDEIEGVQTVLGTGLRSRTVVSWSSATTSWSTLTARLNNMDAGIRSTDPTVHPQYALVAGTSLQPTSTGTVALTVTGFTGSSQPLARFVAPDASTALQVDNNSVTLKSSTVTGSLTVNSSGAVGGVFNVSSGYTGDVIQVWQGTTKVFSVSGDGSAVFSGGVTISGFGTAQHDHSSPAQGGRIIPAGVIQMWAGSNASLPTGWLLCNGQAVSRSTFSELFGAIGTDYGSGNGSTTFNLPNLVNRVARGSNTTAGGATGGADTVTLSATNMPAHVHTINHDHPVVTSGGASTTNVPLNMTTGKEAGSELSGTGVDYLTDGGGLGSGGVALTASHAHTHTVDVPAFSGNSGSAGSGTAVTITNPFQTLHYIIKA